MSAASTKMLSNSYFTRRPQLVNILSYLLMLLIIDNNTVYKSKYCIIATE